MAATRRQRADNAQTTLAAATETSTTEVYFLGKHSPTNKFRWRFSELLPILCDYEKDITYYDCEPSDSLRQQF